jgi:hypothetical protein
MRGLNKDFTFIKALSRVIRYRLVPPYHLSHVSFGAVRPTTNPRRNSTHRPLKESRERAHKAFEIILSFDAPTDPKHCRHIYTLPMVSIVRRDSWTRKQIGVVVDIVPNNCKHDDPLGPSKMTMHCGAEKQPSHLTMQRRGSNGGGSSQLRPILSGGSLRDKFAKFKDASFRLTRQSSGLHLAETGIPAEYDTHHRTIPQNKPRKRVSFDLQRNQVELIIGLMGDTTITAMELWWSSEELNSSRCDGKLAAAVESSAQDYCRAFERAHRQVHTDRKLTAAYLTELVTGLSCGHRGLEQYGAAPAKRKHAIREHVMSVVKCHRDKKLNASSSNSLDDNSSHHSIHSLGSQRSSRSNATAATAATSHTNQNNHSLERTVRNHSAKLSAGNRHFAAALGKAEHLAAIADDKLPNGGGQ